jgi:hypothetical protein
MAKLPEPRLKMRPLKRTVLPTAMAGGAAAPGAVAPGGGAVAAPVYTVMVAAPLSELKADPLARENV